MVDAVVIGAGVNGLAAAVHLAAKGWSVTVVEGNAEPGGAVKTREVTLPGFRHDLAAMNLGMFAGSPFHAVYKDRLAAHGLAFAHSTDAFASPFPDGTFLGVSQTLETTTARIAGVSAADAEAWKALFAEFGGDAPHIFALLGAPMPSWQTAKIAWKAWRAKGLPWLLETGRMLTASPRDWLDARFESEKVKAMMASWGLHLDFSPDVAGGALFPYLESMVNQAFGMTIGAGGADVIIRAMVGLLEASGGEVLTGTPVERIEVSGGRATGVVLADGRRIAATRAVVANVHPKLVFGRLLAADPARAAFDRKIAAFRAGPGTMMIHLATNGLPDWHAGEALKRFAYVHLAPDFATMGRVYTEAMEGLLPAEPVVVVGQPTALDPSRAPAGQHVLWLQVRVLPAEIRGDALRQIVDTDWDAVKDTYADRVLDLVERYAPGLRGKILGRAVFSPRDLERENPNLIGGDNLSGSHHLDQNFLFRPLPGWSRYRTPVDGLHLCGASTWPGAGTGAGSGFLLAQALAGPAKG